MRADFDARFFALARHYRYRIISQRAPVVLARIRHGKVLQPLDVAAMREASQYLLGKHDFSTFRASQSGELTRPHADVLMWGRR